MNKCGLKSLKLFLSILIIFICFITTGFVNKSNYLHCIAVYEGGYEDGGYEDGGSPHSFGYHPTGEVEVDVTLKNKPINLLLSSYEPVNWKIFIKDKKQLKKIYYISYYESTVYVNGVQVKAEKIEDEDLESGSRYRVKNIIGQDPVTYQYEYQNDHFVLNGTNGLEKNTNDYSNDVKHIADRDLYKEGLTFSHNNKGAFSKAFVNKFHKKGKYYFEAEFTMDEAALKSPFFFTNIGIIAPHDQNKYYYCDFDASGDDCLAYGIREKLPRHQKIEKNSVIGFAFDLDKGKIYISLNGVWLGADPKTGDSNYIITTAGRAFTIMVTVDSGTSVKLNLGSEKFKYPVPKGFKRYNSN